MATATQTETQAARVNSHASDHETPLERATERATRANLEPAGYGRMRDGSRFWLVPSTSESDRLHVVRTHHKGHLRCDCESGEHGRVCVHVASVVMEVTAKAIQRERYAERIARCVEHDASAEPCDSVDAETAMWQAMHARTLEIAERLDMTLAQAARHRAEARARRDGYNQALLDDAARRVAGVNHACDAYDRDHPKPVEDNRPVSIFK